MALPLRELRTEIVQILGLVLIFVSFALWGVIAFAVPFLKVAIAQKALVATVLAVISEICFWVGVLIVGKKAAQRYRQYLSFRALWTQLKKLTRR